MFHKINQRLPGLEDRLRVKAVNVESPRCTANRSVQSSALKRDARCDLWLGEFFPAFPRVVESVPLLDDGTWDLFFNLLLVRLVRQTHVLRTVVDVEVFMCAKLWRVRTEHVADDVAQCPRRAKSSRSCGWL